MLGVSFRRNGERLTMRERWLPVAEIAAHLGVNPDTIWKWIDGRKMPAHKLGRNWKFLASEVDQRFRARQAGEDVASTVLAVDNKW
jgi:excisionase family DNA binding protein